VVCSVSHAGSGSSSKQECARPRHEPMLVQACQEGCLLDGLTYLRPYKLQLRSCELQPVTG
jgi:hypothetical protein